MDDETRYIASSSGKPIATSRGYRVVDKNEFKMGVGWWEIDRESRKKNKQMEGMGGEGRMGGKDGTERWDGKMDGRQRQNNNNANNEKHHSSHLFISSAPK